METREEKMSSVQATAYIAGVGFGVARSVLGGHFRMLVVATVCTVLLMFFLDTTADLVRLLILHVALVALILGHALLRKPDA